MTRGHTNIALVGGSRDGQVIKNVSCRNLPESFHLENNVWFLQNKNGDIAITKDGKRGHNWHAYSADVYTKLPNEKYITGTVFEFEKEVIIKRCIAMTKKQARCKNIAGSDIDLCSTHSKC
jgi:hypothetical protein